MRGPSSNTVLDAERSIRGPGSPVSLHGLALEIGELGQRVLLSGHHRQRIHPALAIAVLGIIGRGSYPKMCRIAAQPNIAGVTHGFTFWYSPIGQLECVAMRLDSLPAMKELPVSISPNNSRPNPASARRLLIDQAPKI